VGIVQQEGAIAMEFKRSQEFDDQIESGVHGILGIPSAAHKDRELSSALALLEDATSPFGGNSIPLELQSAEWNDSANYQVALVRLSSKAVRVGTNTQTSLQPKPVLVLPFTWRELVVRLRATADSLESRRETEVVRFGDVFADFHAMEVTRSNESVALTTLEFRLFRFLVQNAGRVVSRDEMLNEVWGYENYPCTRTVDNHILRLRQKLEADPAHPVHFHTVHGVGYKFVREGRRGLPEHKM
jgi:DNA-binding winged helix-turn-helix (wHTH) protein